MTNDPTTHPHDEPRDPADLFSFPVHDSCHVSPCAECAADPELTAEESYPRRCTIDIPNVCLGTVDDRSTDPSACTPCSLWEPSERAGGPR